MIVLKIVDSKIYSVEFKEQCATLFYTSCFIHVDPYKLTNTYDMLLANDFIIISPNRIRFYAMEFVHACRI